MVNLNNTYWDRITGFFTELRVDARWILRENETEKPYGSLRIASHPDLPPGHLRSIFLFVTNKKEKSEQEIIKTIEDYQIDETELEVYAVDEEMFTETKILEAPKKELEDLFQIKIFE